MLALLSLSWSEMHIRSSFVPSRLTLSYERTSKCAMGACDRSAIAHPKDCAGSLRAILSWALCYVSVPSGVIIVLVCTSQ